MGRRDLFVEQQDLACPPLADDQGQELRRTGQRHAAVAGADVTDVDIVGGHRQIAAQVELVAAADDDPVEPRHRRFAQVAQALVDFDELAHPLPVVARPFEELLLVVQVGAGAEGAIAGAGQHQHADEVIPAGILEGEIELGQHGPVDGIEHVRAVQDDRRPSGRLAVADGLERETGRVFSGEGGA